MAIVNQIPASTFNDLAKGAGMITEEFVPETPTLTESQVLCATSGGVNAYMNQVETDHADGIDNAKPGMYELTEITRYDCGFKFDTVTINEKMLSLVIAKSEKSGNKIIAKHGMIIDTDVHTLWYVEPLGGGNVLAVKIMNALTDEGLNFQSENEGNGKITVSLKARYSIKAQETVPMEFYFIESEE